MNRLSFKEAAPYLFFFLVTAGLIALSHWSDAVSSYLRGISLLGPYRVVLTGENLFYLALALMLIDILVLWGREHSRQALQYSFLTIITHKFRTPLSGIKWALNGLREEKTLEEREALLQEIENAAERITQTVDTLAGLAKFNDSMDYAFAAIALRQIVEQSMRKFASMSTKRGIIFKLEPSADVPLIIIDRTKVQFVSDVLLENAIKYSRDGGEVRIAIEKRRRGVMLTISDEGVGLTVGERRKIFGRFYRSKEAQRRDPDGMGLSLSLAHTVMRHHRGSIEAYSRGRGKGATFVATFPLR